MKKILKSLSLIAVVSAIAVGGTVAYFSDEEVSTGNTFTAGTIDIRVNDPTTWRYVMDDMKPGYVDYSNFTVKNDGDNPVNVWKKVSGATTEENGITEPECVAYQGDWTVDLNEPMKGTCQGGSAVNDLASVINYDLSVVVKKADGTEIWNQTLYNEDKTIAQINAMSDNGTFLGMIPVGGSMDVTESYHMITTAGNEHQSDKMTFDITLYGEQLTGEVALEDKDTSNWRVKSETAEQAILTYDVTGNEFSYTLNGVSPLHSKDVALVAGYDGSTNPDTLIGYGTTDASGNIAMNGSVDLNKDLISAKVWLIPKTAWTKDGGVLGHVSNWSSMANFLWETGLIDYYDTDL